MPYDNFYNRDLARNLAAKNRAWAQVHAYSNVSGLNGGAHVKIGNASKHDAVDGTYNNDIELGQSYYMGEGYGHRDVGGSGFASGSFRDTGYESVEGAGSKEYHKVGGFKIGDLGNSDWWKGLRIEGGKHALAVMPDTFEGPAVVPVGKGRSGGVRLGLPDKLAGGEMPSNERAGLQKVVPKAQMPGSSMSGMGKDTELQPDRKAVKGQGKITKKEKEALKSVLAKHGGGRSGGGDGRKRRAEIVKEYMKKHGCKMIEASKKVKELGLYKP